MRRSLPAALAASALAAASLLLAGCGGAPSVAPSPVATPSASATAEAQPLGACARPNLTTMTSGVLTVATDSTPDEPYFVEDEPDSGEGFESAFTYAIASGLGFRATEVEWVTVPFDDSGLPTELDADFAVNEIPITKKGAKLVDFSTPYLTVAADGAGGVPAAGTGQAPDAAEVELGLAFAKGNPLVGCVNEVLAELDASGELTALADEWLTPADAS